MPGRHHHVHTKQGRNDKHIELTLLVTVLAIHGTIGNPPFRLDENDYCADAKNNLHHMDGLGRDIHTAKRIGRGAQEREYHIGRHQAHH